MLYSITCNVDDPAQIKLVDGGMGGDPYMSCPAGTLQVIEYNPTFANMNDADRALFEDTLITILVLAVFAGASVHFLVASIARVTGRKE